MHPVAVFGGHIVRTLITSVSRKHFNSVSLLDAILNVNESVLNYLIILVSSMMVC